jgi:small-conductance mechanosensitive channel
MSTLGGPTHAIASELYELWLGFLQALPRCGFALLALLLTVAAAKLAPRAVLRLSGRALHRQSLRDLVRQLTFTAVWIVGALVAAMIAAPSLTPGRLIAVVGLGSVAIGFAFKDIFENFFAGVLILWRFPLETGDLIECKGIEGRVEDITIRMTLLRRMDGQLVALPNAMLFKNPVTVRTNRSDRRTMIAVAIENTDDADRARKVLHDAVAACPSVSKEQPVQVFAREFGDGSIVFDVGWWSGSQPGDVRSARDEAIRAVKRALEGAGIKLPAHTLTVVEPDGRGPRGRGVEGSRGRGRVGEGNRGAGRASLGTPSRRSSNRKHPEPGS